MQVRQPNIDVHGPVAFHDQACPVYREKHAVLNLATGIFHPSWDAQSEGYRLVKADTWLRRFALRFFDSRDRLT